ncbi:MAG TPA: hypothetical protein PLS43_08955, partial [Syntrophales bacterium]|nr:hypothetical protein [Syntrophales bacterium]
MSRFYQIFKEQLATLNDMKKCQFLLLTLKGITIFPGSGPPIFPPIWSGVGNGGGIPRKNGTIPIFSTHVISKESRLVGTT